MTERVKVLVGPSRDSLIIHCVGRSEVIDSLGQSQNESAGLAVLSACPEALAPDRGATTRRVPHGRMRRDISCTLMPQTTFTSRLVRITARFTTVAREGTCAAYRTHRRRTERDRAKNRSIRCFGQV
eukprot:COSAG02_NODE_982_length_15475_cov_30.378674_8_plen_127_part_00